MRRFRARMMRFAVMRKIRILYLHIEGKYTVVQEAWSENKTSKGDERMIQTIRLLEYMAVLKNKEEILNNCENEKYAMLKKIENEIDKCGNASTLKALMDDIWAMAEENGLLLGLYYGTHLVALVNDPVTLPDEY